MILTVYMFLIRAFVSWFYNILAMEKCDYMLQYPCHSIHVLQAHYLWHMTDCEQVLVT